MKNRGIVGLWFHEVVEQTGVYRQGQILRKLTFGRYEVQLYSYLTGRPSNKEVFSRDRVRPLHFYPTDKTMRAVYDRTRHLFDEVER